ncbi:hypothetical protein ACF0H5_017451 [Mactra antiquata]
MPIFNVFTNLSKDKIPDFFLLDASKFIACLLGKPETYVTVRVVPDQMMSHGGSTEPCASVQLMSIGNLGDQNKCHSENIGSFLKEQLGIPNDRYYIIFTDVARNDCGYSGKTFAT